MNNITDKGLVFVDKRAHALAGVDQSLITFKSLREGDIFDQDIKRIMAVIDGVERQFGEKKISKDF